MRLFKHLYSETFYLVGLSHQHLDLFSKYARPVSIEQMGALRAIMEVNFYKSDIIEVYAKARTHSGSGLIGDKSALFGNQTKNKEGAVVCGEEFGRKVGSSGEVSGRGFKSSFVAGAFVKNSDLNKSIKVVPLSEDKNIRLQQHMCDAAFSSWASGQGADILMIDGGSIGWQPGTAGVMNLDTALAAHKQMMRSKNPDDISMAGKLASAIEKDLEIRHIVDAEFGDKAWASPVRFAVATKLLNKIENEFEGGWRSIVVSLSSDKWANIEDGASADTVTAILTGKF